MELLTGVKALHENHFVSIKCTECLSYSFVGIELKEARPLLHCLVKVAFGLYHLQPAKQCNSE